MEHNVRDLRKQFMRYVPLNVLGMLALSCYILADTFFVANGVGGDGLTALNLVLPIYSFISGLGLLFGMGGATQYSIFKGAQEVEKASKVFTRTMLLCLGSGLAVTALGAFFAQDICVLLGADESIVPLATEYLRTIMLFSTAFILNNALVCFVRNDGDPRLSMLAMLIGSLSNVALDYIFIFPLGMGMFGAAIATCLAPIIGMVTLSFHLLKKSSGLRLARCRLRPTHAAQICSIGFSAFIAEFSTGIVMLIFNFIILSLAGNIGVAAYGVIANLNLFAVAIFAGISEGMQPLISNAYGARELPSLWKVYRWAFFLAAYTGIALYAVMLIFAEPIAQAFNSDGNPEFIRLAVQGIRLYFPMLFLTGINIVTASLFASISQPGGSFLISSSRSIVLVVVFALTLSRLQGMTGVWCALPCAEAVTFVMTLLLLKRLTKTAGQEQPTAAREGA